MSLVAISSIVSARNLSTGKVFGTSLDPCITFPRTNESVMLDSIAFHPLVLDDQNFVNFTEELFKKNQNGTFPSQGFLLNCCENQIPNKRQNSPFMISYVIVK